MGFEIHRIKLKPDIADYIFLVTTIHYRPSVMFLEMHVHEHLFSFYSSGIFMIEETCVKLWTFYVLNRECLFSFDRLVTISCPHNNFPALAVQKGSLGKPGTIRAGHSC